MAKNTAIREGTLVARCDSRTDVTVHFLDELPRGVVINADGWEYWGHKKPFGAVWEVKESKTRWEILGVFDFRDEKTAREVRIFCEEMRESGAAGISDEASRRIEEEAEKLGPCGDQLRLLATYAARIGRLRPNGITC